MSVMAAAQVLTGKDVDVLDEGRKKLQKKLARNEGK